LLPQGRFDDRLQIAASEEGENGGKGTVVRSSKACIVSEMLRHFGTQAQADSLLDLAVP